MNLLLRFLLLAALVAAAPAKGRNGHPPTSQHAIAPANSSIALIADGSARDTAAVANGNGASRRTWIDSG